MIGARKIIKFCNNKNLDNKNKKVPNLVRLVAS